MSRLDVSGSGPDSDAAAADAFVRGSASDLVLMFYGRIPLKSVELGGNVNVLTLLREWDT